MAGITNPHSSMVFHHPESKDHNQYEIMNSSRDKTRLILEYMDKWKGKQLYVVNVKSGEVRLWEMRLNAFGRPTRHARVNVVHLLFGDWRLATDDDIQRQASKDKVLADHLARTEANKTAIKANIMFSELTKASAAIQNYNALKEQVPEKPAEKPLTLSDLDKLQAQLDAARKLFEKPDEKPEGSKGEKKSPKG